MISMRQILFRGRALAHRQVFETELDEELRFHLEMETAANVERGMSPEEARRVALRDFGGVDKVKDECWDERGLPWLETLLKDVRYGSRLLRRSPGFTAAAVLTLALGIGANTAIFSAVNTVLLRPLPVPDLDRLVRVYDELPGLNLQKAEMSAGEVADLAARTDLFEVAAGFREQSATLEGIGEARRVELTATMGSFFELLHARPHLGRLYRPEESQPGRQSVAVLSHSFWQELTGGDRSIVGRTLNLNGVRYEVVGVLPPELQFPRKAEMWVPLEVKPEILGPDWRLRLFLSFVGRLQPDVTPAQLAGQLTAEGGRWHDSLAGTYNPDFQHTLSSEPFVDSLAGPLRPILLTLMGAVLLVLLIACANVASLQMVRATGRWKELAVRAALGAGRASLVRQLLTESLIVAFAGGAMGLLLGAGAVRLLSGWDAAGFEALQDLRLDPVVLGFTLVMTVFAALLFGTVPALRASRTDPQDVLKEAGHQSSGGARQQRMLQAGVVLQCALTLALLLGSALTLQSLSRLLAIDPGFQPEQVMTMNVGLSRASHSDGPSRTAFFEGILARLQGMPGVEAAGLVSGLPFSEGGDSSPFDIQGWPEKPGAPERHANMRVVGGDYFRVLGIPLLRGRLFDWSDAPTREDGSVPFAAIIDETLAKKYFGDEDPIGHTISQGSAAVIVGVVGGVRDQELGQEAYPTVYYLQRQYNFISSMSIVVRSTLEAPAVTELVRSVVGELHRGVPLYDIAPLSERVGESLGHRRLATTVLTSFAVLSLLLAVLGIYGVISYGVSQRRQEIGIRIALGARPGDVVGMVLRSGLTLIATGAGAGTLLYLGLWGGLSSVVYGVEPHDPRLLLPSILLLTAVAALACYLPARRAARVNPLEALRAG